MAENPTSSPAPAHQTGATTTRDLSETAATGAGAGPSPSQSSGRAFRDTVGLLPTGVTIVTTAGPEGPAGMTTNAVTSLSLDPALLLVCFDNASRTLPIMRAAGRFAVNVLRTGQEDLAALFASKRVAREKFEAVTHTEAHGVPVLDGALAWLACDLRELHPGGDHTIAIGAVIGMGGDRAGEPLVFFGGRYVALG